MKLVARLFLSTLSALAIAYGQSARAVEISAPVNESAFRTGSDITLTAWCAGSSASVRFLVDGASIGEAPCGGAFVWKGAPSGIHAISGVLGVESEPALVFVNDSATRPRVESVQGVVRAVVEDRFEQRTSHTYYSISAKGASIPIAFPTAAVRAALRSGKPVTLEGFRDSGHLYPRVTDVVEPEATAAPLAAFGVRRVAVILVNFLNQTNKTVTQAQAVSMMSTINQYFQETSYGQYSVTGDVYGYLSLPMNEPCTASSDTTSSAFTTITDAGVQAAANAGIDLSPYQSYLFVAPTDPSCFAAIGFAGIASIGGSPGMAIVLVPTSFEPSAVPRALPIYVHELGHNLGLYHPHAYACGLTIYNPGVACGAIEYGDGFDVMGSSYNFFDTEAHVNASYKDILGWLPPQVVASTGVYSLLPYEAKASSLKILPQSSADAFYVEYRQPIGFDNFIATADPLGGDFNFLPDVFKGGVRSSTWPEILHLF